MAFRLAALACAAFTAVCIYMFAMARTLYDAGWIIAILSIPASMAADLVAEWIARWGGVGQKNVYVDLGSLYVFGVVEYGLIGYVIGWAIDRARARKRRTPQ